MADMTVIKEFEKKLTDIADDFCEHYCKYYENMNDSLECGHSDECPLYQIVS